MLGRRIVLRASRLTLVLAFAIVALFSAHSAIAATAPWQSIDLTLSGSKAGNPVLLVSGRLPAGTSLPAKVTLAIPSGARIGWAGEILGGDPAKDPRVQYTVTKARGYDLVEFTVAKSRIAQIEADVPGAYATTGKTTKAVFAWIAPYDIPNVTMWIQLPVGASVTTGTPGGQTVPSATGPLYRLGLARVAQGANLGLDVTYATAAGSANASGAPSGQASAGSTAGTPTSNSRFALYAIGGLLVLALAFLALRRFSNKSDLDEDSDDSDDV